MSVALDACARIYDVRNKPPFAFAAEPDGG